MQALYIPRKKYILPKGEIDNCPDCNTQLIAEQSTIMLYGKSDIDEGEFVSNMSGSHFCPTCPVVIFEKETIKEAISFSLRAKNGFIYDVLGLVDYSKVPDSKRHLPLGTDENPYPFVDFLNDDFTKKIKPEIQEKNTKPKRKPKPFRDRKIGRNAPCPCGSGKKYKKCCL